MTEELEARPRNISSPHTHPGTVVWITGLSGAGKSTLAAEVVRLLRDAESSVVRLDGDELREIFVPARSAARAYRRDTRIALAMQYSRLCRVLSEQGIIVVIATISLFKDVHDWNRRHLPRYFEIYLKVPLDELRRRDPKGIYRSFDEGKITHVAGLDLAIDEPQSADCLVEFDPQQDVSETAEAVIKILNMKQVKL